MNRPIIFSAVLDSSLRPTWQPVDGRTRHGHIDTDHLVYLRSVNLLNPGNIAPSGYSIIDLTYNQDARPASLNSNGQPAIGFAYDGFGQRLSIENIPHSYTTIYQYDQGGHLLEEENATGAAQADYIYLNGRPIAVLNPPTGALSFLHDDRLGTPQMATDSGQNIAWQTTYDPFGNTGSIGGTITQDLRLPGQVFDEIGGEYLNGFRDYLPLIGRYIEPDPDAMQGRSGYYPAAARLSEDPMEFVGSGSSLYEYAGDNPISFIDPSGLQTTFIVWNPVGYGESSLGHVSVIIDDESYSFGPNGMDVESADQYLARNTAFRNGLGDNLNLTRDQENWLANFLKNYNDKYHALGRNCTSPIREGLKDLGYTLDTPSDPFTMLPPLVWVPSDVQWSLENTPGLVTGWAGYSKN